MLFARNISKNCKKIHLLPILARNMRVMQASCVKIACGIAFFADVWYHRDNE
jgi:hypothetical protein